MGVEVGMADKKWGSNAACGPRTRKSGGSTDSLDPVALRPLRWIFPAVMPRRTSSGSDIGFSLRHFSASACRWTLVFLRRGFLHMGRV